MRSLNIAGRFPDVAAGRRLLARVFRARDTPEPVAAWRAAPEAALRALTPAERVGYIEALLPLVRSDKAIKLSSLRRLYQLFAFMKIPAGERLQTLSALHGKLRLEPSQLAEFSDKRVRKSLLGEAIAFAGRSPDNAAKAYLARLSAHLKVDPDETIKWIRFFERLTELENRAAVMLGKKGHIVRLDDRKLEIFKKAVASVGVPAAALFPLGTVGLSVEGITTGLIAMGGGFILPASVAMITGLGVAVALGVTSKKLLDMVLPTTDADRVSIDIEKLSAEAARIGQVLDDAVSGEPDQEKLKNARSTIAEILKKILPLDETARAKLEAAFERARELGERYLSYLTEDREALENRNQMGADEIASLLELDGPVISPALGH